MDRHQRRREKKKQARKERLRRRAEVQRRRDARADETAEEDRADEAANVSPFLWPSALRKTRAILALRQFEDGEEIADDYTALRRAPRKPEAEAGSVSSDSEQSEIERLRLEFDELTERARAGELEYAERLLPVGPENVEELGTRIQILNAAIDRWTETVKHASIVEASSARAWDNSAIRSLSRTRVALADALERAGRFEEAMAQYAHVLEADPEDHPHAQGLLLGACLVVGDLPRARSVLIAAKHDVSSVALWGAVLERFLAADRSGARRALQRARRFSPAIESILVPRDEMLTEDDEEVDSVEREVIDFIACLGNAWKKCPEAIEWLWEGGMATTADERRSAPGTYGAPVSRLLELGQVGFEFPWRNYAVLCELGRADVSELVRMASDPALHEADQDETRVWAPVHAWRALSQLDADAALKPMVRTLIDYGEDDWCHEDFPHVVSEVGAPGIPHAAALLEDHEAGESARMTAAVALTKVAEVFASERVAVVQILARTLDAFETNGKSLNAVLVGELATLKAKEHAALIRRAFERDRVDELICESLEAIEEELAE